MKIKLIVFLCTYIAVGAIYAVTFGFNTRAAIERLGPRIFEPEIARVEKAWIDGGKNLIICFQGRMQRDSSHLSSQYLKISLKRVTNSDRSLLEREYKYSSYGLTELIFPKEDVVNGCPYVEMVDKVDVYSKSIESDDLRKILTSYVCENELCLMDLSEKSSEEKRNTIALKFSGKVVDKSDYAIVRLERIVVNGGNFGWFNVVYSFIVDTVFYPYQVAMWTRYASSH